MSLHITNLFQKGQGCKMFQLRGVSGGVAAAPPIFWAGAWPSLAYQGFSNLQLNNRILIEYYRSTRRCSGNHFFMTLFTVHGKIFLIGAAINASFEKHSISTNIRVFFCIECPSHFCLQLQGKAHIKKARRKNVPL